MRIENEVPGVLFWQRSLKSIILKPYALQMKKNLFSFFCMSLLVLAFHTTRAQNNFFKDVSESEMTGSDSRVIFPQKKRNIKADIDGLKMFLQALPTEANLSDRSKAPVLILPMPDGRNAAFRVWESSIQEPGLEAKFPEISTFSGQGIDDPYATIRMDFNPYFGFHAQILSIHGNVYIDPFARGNINDYVCYYGHEYFRDFPFNCNFENPETAAKPGEVQAVACRGQFLKTFRLAVACTGEYAQAVGGSSNAAALHAAIVTTVNRVVGVYEKEISVRLVLVANNNLIEYQNANTDPFTGNSNTNAGQLIDLSQTVITGRIGTGNYDIGHTFSTGAGGLAVLGCICDNSIKARGVTGSPSPIGDRYDIDFVAHEMGHQLGASHSFNSQTGGCGGNRNQNTAYEVGSGTTIMGYAGLCSSDDIQSQSDAFFHATSYDEISARISSTCGTNTATNNSLPSITAMEYNGTYIPISTPFTLTGTAIDQDNDALTYSWEEWDLGPATEWNKGNNNTTSPLFKSRIPKTSGSRTFPDIGVIVDNYPTSPTATVGGKKGETLPSRARSMKFKLTVRDNRAGGSGVVSGGAGCQTGWTSDFKINITGTTAFQVTYPNGGETIPAGSQIDVKWNVAATNVAPINTSNVRIMLSVDSGFTFPYQLVASTDNDGSESVTLPVIQTTKARVKVEAIGNIYFDISNRNFTLSAPIAGFTFRPASQGNIVCGIGNNGNITLATSVTGGFNTPITLTASNNPASTTVSFSKNPLNPGDSTVVTLNNTSSLTPGIYNVKISGVAGNINQSTSVDFVVLPGQGPSISSQPLSASLCEEAAASFNATVSGADSLQWQVSTDNGLNWSGLTEGGLYTGTRSAALQIPVTTLSQDNYQFRLLAYGRCGNSFSNAALLNILPLPAIASSLNSQNICSGSTLNLSILATGANLTYQWEKSTDGCNSYSLLPGDTTSSLIIPTVNSSLNDNCFRVRINGLCLTQSILSNAAIIKVFDNTAITSAPQSLAICEGSNAQFSVNINGGINSLQWQVLSAGASGWTNIPGEDSEMLVISNPNTSFNNYAYRLLVSGCNANLVTDSALLQVFDSIQITKQPVTKNICLSGLNNVVNFNSKAAGNISAYQWQVFKTGSISWTDLQDDATYAGSLSDSLLISNPDTSFSGNLYRLKITGFCNPSGLFTDSSISLTVKLPIKILQEPSDSTVCLNRDSSAKFSVVSQGTGITYQWQQRPSPQDSWTNISNANSGILDLRNLTVDKNGYEYRVVMNGACSNNIISRTAKLSIYGDPFLTNLRDTLICLPGPVIFLANTDNSAIAYQWQSSTDNGASWDSLSGANSKQYNTGLLQISDNGKLIRVVVNTSTCSGIFISKPAKITTGVKHDVSIQGADNFSITPSARIKLNSEVSFAANYAYKWYRNNGGQPFAITKDVEITAASAGRYFVTALNPASNCLDSSETVVIDAAASDRLYIFPNPNNGRFTISYYYAGVNSSEIRTLNIYDSKGAKVLSRNESISQPYTYLEVNLPQAAAGTYMVELLDKSKKRVATGKVMIQ